MLDTLDMKAQHLTETVARGTFWLSTSSIVLKVVSVATLFLILGHLSVYEYGLVKLVLSIIPILSIIMLPGIQASVVADMSFEKGRGDIGKFKGLLHSYARMQVFLGVAAWAIMFFGAGVVAKFYAGQADELIRIASFAFLVSPLRVLTGVLLSVHLKFFTQAAFSFLGEIFKFILLLFVFFILEEGTRGVIFATVAAEFLAVALFTPIALLTYVEYKGSSVSNVSILGLVGGHRFWGMLANYLSISGGNIRLWIIKFILGTEAVGIFSVAYGVISHVTSISPLGKVIAPIMPRYVNDNNRLRRLVAKSVKYQSIAFVWIGAAAFIGVPILIQTLFPNYVASLPMFNIMLFALIPLTLAPVLSNAFLALKAQRSLFNAVAFKTVMSVLLAVPFAWYFGVQGLAYEFVITTSIFAAGRYVVLKRLIPGLQIKIKDMLSFDDDDRMIIATLKKRTGHSGT